jgi:endonuclease YncB( thermonuclease family)
MKNAIFLVLILMLSTTSVDARKKKLPSPNVYSAVLERVIDGDTILAFVEIWPKTYVRVSVRVNGVDTPESKKNLAKCQKELKKGLEAKEFVKVLMKNVEKIILKHVKLGKYAGRVLADVHFKLKGSEYSLSDVLIKRGYARPYFGKKKSDWCK